MRLLGSVSAPLWCMVCVLLATVTSMNNVSFGRGSCAPLQAYGGTERLVASSETLLPQGGSHVSTTLGMPVGRANWSRCPDSDGCVFVFLTRTNSYPHSRTNRYAIKH